MDDDVCMCPVGCRNCGCWCHDDDLWSPAAVDILAGPEANEKPSP